MSPLPPLKVFERIQVSEGLLITTDRWRRSHAYHRQRQNFHFQALHCPGILCGLGVAVVPAPADIEPHLQDGRWLQIQAGMAIDAAGNPIVVPQPEAFQLRSVPPPGHALTVYLVLNYVDPDDLRPRSGEVPETVREQFRIAEKISLDPLDVELCRLQLEGDSIRLSPAADVDAPGLNTPDLRHRQPVRLRPEATVQVSLLTRGTPTDDHLSLGLSQLIQSGPALYPALTMEPLQHLPLSLQTPSMLASTDLLCLSDDTLAQLPRAFHPLLKRYLDQGGTLLVMGAADTVNLSALTAVRRELMTALADLEKQPDTTELQSSLLAEIEATEAEIAQTIQSACQTVLSFASQIQYPITSTGLLARQHPLRHAPFLFARLPEIEGHPINLFAWGGILLLIGPLVAAWGLDEDLRLPRETLRTAQEFGMNLLYFAWRRHHLTQLQQAAPTEQTPDDPSLTQQVSHG